MLLLPFVKASTRAVSHRALTTINGRVFTDLQDVFSRICHKQLVTEMYWVLNMLYGQKASCSRMQPVSHKTIRKALKTTWLSFKFFLKTPFYFCFFYFIMPVFILLSLFCNVMNTGMRWALSHTGGKIRSFIRATLGTLHLCIRTLIHRCIASSTCLFEWTMEAFMSPLRAIWLCITISQHTVHPRRGRLGIAIFVLASLVILLGSSILCGMLPIEIACLTPIKMALMTHMGHTWGYTALFFLTYTAIAWTANAVSHILLHVDTWLKKSHWTSSEAVCLLFSGLTQHRWEAYLDNTPPPYFAVEKAVDLYNCISYATRPINTVIQSEMYTALQPQDAAQRWPDTEEIDHQDMH